MKALRPDHIYTLMVTLWVMLDVFLLIYAFYVAGNKLLELKGVVEDVHIVGTRKNGKILARIRTGENRLVYVKESFAMNLRWWLKRKPKLNMEGLSAFRYGRVKVQFHWDREGTRDQNSSCWIRVSQPWAGKGWGAVSIPRIGQEVVVDFLEGNPDRPLITGRVYNAESMPPYALPGGANMMGFKSDSTPGGGGYNEIVISTENCGSRTPSEIACCG